MQTNQAFSNVLISACLCALVGCGGGDDGPAVPPDASPPTSVTLTGHAILRATTFALGPSSGADLGSDAINGQALPFESQPVQGLSALVRDPSDDTGETYLALVDNGYGSRDNSADFYLRVYRIRPDLRTAEAGSGDIEVLSFFDLRDPDQLVEFPITDQASAERKLTGADFDPESLQVGANGDLWIGDEFGPYVLHFNQYGVLLDAPIALPADLAEPGPADAGTSGTGFQGMALSSDGATLWPIRASADEREWHLYEFDIASRQYTGVRYRYPLAEAGHRVGALVMLDDSTGLAIEHDTTEATLSGYKRVHEITLASPDQPVTKRELIDLSEIADPERVGIGAEGDVGVGEAVFGLPFAAIGGLVVLDDSRVGVMTDNNFPFGQGRSAGSLDDTEFVVLALPEPLSASTSR